jgi:sorbitol-6-phosphate 2-dehydrogenase
MSELNRVSAAPFVRALYLDEFDKPFFIASRTQEKTSVPESALFVDLSYSQELLDDGGFKLAARLKNGLAEWRKARPSSEEGVSMPGCVVLALQGGYALYWADQSFDSAARRAEMSLSSPIGRAPAGAFSALSSCKRGEVVRGKIALVTGGAQGFGAEIARGLAESGAFVFVADVNLAGAENLAASLNADLGCTAAVALSVDVTDEDSVASAFARAVEFAGGLDLVVSNAGILEASSLFEQDLDSFRRVTEVDYTGYLIVAKHAAIVMRSQALGAPRWKTDIIQINSKSGLQGSNKNASYAGAKFGGIGLTQSFALELIEWGIKVNAICPGNFFDGPLWSDPEKGLFVQYLRSGKVPGAKTIADVKAAYEAKVPMGRGCTAADVMRAIYYIVEQEYETGQAVPVTGGQVMLG